MFATFFAAVLFSQAAGTTLTLEDALARASARAPEVDANLGRIGAEDAIARASGRRFLRSPEATVAVERSPETGFYADGRETISIADQWLLSQAPRDKAAAARTRAEAWRRDLDRIASTRASDALARILKSRRLRTRLEIEIEFARSVAEIATATKRRVRDGLTGATDATVAGAEAARMASAAEMTRAELARENRALEILVGVSAGTVAISGDPARGSLPDDASALVARAIRSNPSIRVLDARIDAAVLEAAGARAGRIPSLRVGLSAARQVNGVPGSDFEGAPAGFGGFRKTEFVAGATLGVVFPARGATLAEAATADAERRTLQAERTGVLLGITVEARSAFDERRIAEKRVEDLSHALDGVPEAILRLETAYREGRLSLDTLLTQRERIQALSLAVVDALDARDAADVALSRALGGPWGISLLPPPEAP